MLATGKIAEIVPVIAPSRLVCSAVSGESLYLRPLEPGGKLEVVDLTPLFDAGALTATTLNGETEEDLYVNYALELDDGEAMSLAIAQARDLGLATDERKARRVLRENAPHIPVISTAEIMHAWAQVRDQAEVVATLRLIHSRARFRPPDSDPLVVWWNQMLEQ